MNKLFTMTLVGALASSFALAQEALPDPTRPPTGLQAAGAASAPGDEAGALVLQSVMLGTGRSRAAVISGQLVKLGDKVGEQRLAFVSQHSVQLTGPQGSVILTLAPEVQKQSRRKPTEPMK